jgi:hypothetical protein
MMRNKIFAALTMILSVGMILAAAEIVLRFLPVAGGFNTIAVTDADPIFRFTPNQNVTWSKGWNFTMVNRVHVNNAGYVNDQDYDAADPRPLLAVVGDSYVEAVMVPYAQTLQARLAAAVAPRARVYSYGASGAPLSQYLIWAREARERWKASALIIVVVGNDFDESLAVYKTGPGFHHYVAGPDGKLTLRRFDYQPSRLGILVRSSALARYLVFHLNVREHVHALIENVLTFVGSARAETYVGNTAAANDSERLRWSEAAVKAFLRDLVAYAGWRPEQVTFLVDGIRYPSTDPVVMLSYFTRMRNYFISESQKAGFEAIDMDTHFFPRFKATNERYDFPTDGHWNGLGHQLAAEAAQKSTMFARWQAGMSRAPGR